MHARRTPSRRLAGSAALLVLATSLAACGSGGSSEPTLGLDSVTISGKVGSALKIAFDGQVTDATTTTKVLTEGTGDKIADGDDVIVHAAVADGFTQQTVQSSYRDHAPQLVPVDSNLNAIYRDALVGHPIGSRVVVAAAADKLYGQGGNPQLGIGNKDVLIIVFDVVGKPLDQPDGQQKPAPSWAPKIEMSGGKPSGLDFSKAPAPDGTLHEGVLRTGTGAPVKKGQTVFARYLGEVSDGSKPFDENFSKGDPAPFRVGVGAVVKGWDKTLVGNRVGSEVILEIPPRLGYGAKGQPSAGIKGGATLYFVVQILGAA